VFSLLKYFVNYSINAYFADFEKMKNVRKKGGIKKSRVRQKPEL